MGSMNPFLKTLETFICKISGHRTTKEVENNEDQDSNITFVSFSVAKPSAAYADHVDEFLQHYWRKWSR